MDAIKILFIDNLLKCLGNITWAAELTTITRQTYYNWLVDDPKFKEAIESITPDDYLKAKKEFYEMQLLKLSDKLNPAAVIFANKTINKDLGYFEKSEIDLKNINITWIEQVDKEDTSNNDPAI